MRKLLVLSVLLLMGATNTAQAKTHWHPVAAKKCPGVVRAVEFYKTATWKWQNEFEIRHSKASHRRIPSCSYGTWVAKLWRKRAWRLRDLAYAYARADKDFNRAAAVAHRIFPAISTERLWNRADAEGGHGLWVWNNSGSHAGGWFQFMEGTFYSYSHAAFAYAREHGLPIPRRYNSFYSMLGQNVTAAYMFQLGLECSGVGWAASC